ncbi:MAG: RDD family protein [Bdellovibrionales bacterium]
MTTDAEITTLPYASFGKRVYAYLIDQSVIQLLALAIAYPIGKMHMQGQPESMEALLDFLNWMMPVITLIQIVIALLYGTLFEGSSSGATWGKRYCGLRVCTEEGESLSYFEAFLRNVGVNLIYMVLYFNFIFALLVLPIYLTPLFLEKRQTSYDQLLKLLVIRTK